MGAMKELLLEAEYVFTGEDKVWERLEEVTGREFRGGAKLDLGLLVYAFAGGRWSWMPTSDTPKLEDAFYLGGEGMDGDSPIICGFCAGVLAFTLGMNPDEQGGWTAEDAPIDVSIKPLELPRSLQPLKQCPCGNYLFGLVSKDELMKAHTEEGMPLELMYDFVRELTYALQDAGGYELRTMEPYFLAEEDEDGRA